MRKKETPPPEGSHARVQFLTPHNPFFKLFDPVQLPVLPTPAARPHTSHRQLPPPSPVPHNSALECHHFAPSSAPMACFSACPFTALLMALHLGCCNPLDPLLSTNSLSSCAERGLKLHLPSLPWKASPTAIPVQRVLEQRTVKFKRWEREYQSPQKIFHNYF